MNKKVLVLGGSYFVGLSLVNNLIKDGFDVTTLNRGTKNPMYCGALNKIICDRKDKEGTRRCLSSQSFDYVIDVSGYSVEDAEIVYGALDTSMLKQYIFISSSAVYCPSKALPLKENDPKGENYVWGDYGTKKLEIEKYFLRKYQENAFPVIILRPPYIYGAGNNIYREAFVFDRILDNRPILLPNKGETKVQFLHTIDLFKTVVSLFGKGNAVGQAFNIGNEEPISFKEWVKLCMAACGIKIGTKYFKYLDTEYTCRDFFPLHDYEYYLDIEKISTYHKNEISMLEGLKEAFEWYCLNRNAVSKKPHYEINEKEILSMYF